MYKVGLISLVALPTALGGQPKINGKPLWIHPNGNTAMCLDLLGGKADNGDSIDIWTCNPASLGQQWYWNPGTYKMRSVIDPSKCIDANDMKEGTQLQIWDCNIAPQQFWGWSDKYQNIFLQSTLENGPITMCMDVKDGQFKDGNAVQVAKCDGNPKGNQGFAIIKPTPPPKPFKINIVGKNSCLDLYAGKATNGGKIEVWDCFGGKGQQWFFEPGTFKIKSVVDPTKCIDAKADMKQRNELQLWDCTAVPQQTWGFDANSKAIFLGSDPKKMSLCMCLTDFKNALPMQWCWDRTVGNHGG
jgi:hypothetical protein